MFVLSKVDNVKEKFALVPNKAVYTIGRLSTDLILSEDLSISRTHVRLILPSAGTTETLAVIDLGSKYGTFLNNDIQLNKKMQAKTEIPLQVGDKIRLGALKNVWQVSQLQLVTTPSALGRAELEALQQLLQPLGGQLQPSWTKECSHLTMDNVTVTVKLLHALLDNKPIVTLAFWRQLSKTAQRVHILEDWPNPLDFPPAQTKDMPSIKWNPKRTKLFAGKTFVFCNRKHYEMYATVVQKAGGACKDLNSGVRRQLLIKNEVVVIQYVPSTQSQATETIHSVQEILEQAGRRLIPDYEIGLAVLHCSTDKFCNPAHKMIENTLATTESMNSSLLIANTESTQKELNTSKETEFILSETQGNDDEQLTETQPAPVAASKSMLTLRRRNNVMFKDSSEEELELKEAAVKETAAKPKPKRKLAIAVDTSDEEEQQLRKITKTLPGDKSKQQPADKVEIAAKTTANQQLEKPAEPPTRRSLRGKQLPAKQDTSVAAMAEGNSEQQAEVVPLKTKATAKTKQQLKPKQATLTVPQMDEDSEEEEALFQFDKRTAAAKEATKELLPTVSNKSIANQLPKINVRNFLSKSQRQSQVEAVETVATQPRKRLRLEQLNESDSDDNEDLFKFGSSKKKPKNANNAHEDKSTSQLKQQHNERDDDQDSVSTEPFVPLYKAESKYVLPKPKMQPLKVDISGWLSCNQTKPKTAAEGIKMDAETAEPTIKQELADCEEKAAHLNYIESMRDSIQVRMCSLEITVRAHDASNAADLMPNNKYSGRKNFKKFVKNQILYPHERILPMKRMQIAEGKVKLL